MTPLRNISVLMVEDFAPIRQRLRSMLSGTPGVEVVGEATSVAEALRLFSDRRPDAVILDIHLPDGNGIDVLRTIKAASPACVVIMLTSHDSEEYRSACRESGASHFFEKATEFERLVDTLGALRSA